MMITVHASSKVATLSVVTVRMPVSVATVSAGPGLLSSPTFSA